MSIPFGLSKHFREVFLWGSCSVHNILHACTRHSTPTVMTEGMCPTSPLESAVWLLNCFHNPLNVPSYSLFHLRILLHLISISFLLYLCIHQSFSSYILILNYLRIHQVAKMNFSCKRWCLSLLQCLFCVALHLSCTVHWIVLLISAKNFRVKEVSDCDFALCLLQRTQLP